MEERGFRYDQIQLSTERLPSSPLTSRTDRLDLNYLRPIPLPQSSFIKSRRPNRDNPDPILILSRLDLQNRIPRINRPLEGSLFFRTFGMGKGDDIGYHAHVQATGKTREEVFVHRRMGGEEVSVGVGRVEEFGQDGGNGC